MYKQKITYALILLLGREKLLFLLRTTLEFTGQQLV